MSTYARGWIFGALCAMSALVGGWAVAATLQRSEGPGLQAPADRHSLAPRVFVPQQRSMPPMSDHPALPDTPRLIAC